MKKQENELKKHLMEQLYLDAQYYHLIHTGHTFKLAKLKIKQIKHITQYN